MNKIVVILVDKNFRIVWTSKHPAGDAPYMNQSVLDLLGPEDQEPVKNAFVQAVLNGQPAEVVYDVPYWEGINDPPITRRYKTNFVRVDGIPAIAAALIADPVTNGTDLFNEVDHEILRCLSDDRSVAQIAEHLGRAESTIALRIRHMKDKLNVSSLAGLVASALRRKIII